MLAACALATAADSDVDTSFGIFSTGHNVVSLNGGGGNGDAVAETLVAPNGSLYLVGTSDIAGGQTRIALVHLVANGRLDTGFGSNGHYVGPTFDIKAAAAAFAPNGGILVAGTRRIAGDNTNFTVCRLRNAGIAQFGNTGLPCITLAFDLGGTLQDTARDIVLLDDGRIALVGSAAAANGVIEAAVAMIHADGTPDVVFGPGGKRHWIQNGLHEVNLHAAVLDFDVIQVVGDAREEGSPRLGAFSAWVNPGTGAHLSDKIDYLADANGKAFYRDVVLDNGPDLRILAVGGVLQNGKYRGVLTRVNQFGDYDTIWANGNGYAAINAGESVQLTKVVKQSNGKLLVAGTLQKTGFTGSSLLVGRYNANGSLDLGSFNLLQGYREIDFRLPGNYDYGAVLAR